MIEVTHPLRSIVERHWPTPPTNDPAAAFTRHQAIGDLIEELLETVDLDGCNCGCECCS